jgi:DNA polymerase I-like protein with 3'-5' exonuclease and polymerase domains
MVSAFQAGQDLHTITAMAIYGLDDESEVKKEQRQIAKSANFGLLYGSGAKGLRSYAGASGIQMTLDEANAIRDKFHAAYAGISKWQRNNAAAAQNSGKDASLRVRVSNLRRFLPGEHNKLTTRCNTPIQGAGAAVMKLTLGKLWPLLREAGEAEVRLAGAIHDELILLVREDAAERWAVTLAQVMEEAESRWLGDVPPLAEAKIGRTWSEAK